MILMPRRPWVPPPKPQVAPYRPPSGTRYFTHYWANDTWAENSHAEGEPFRHAASNLFRSRGVASGDFVYVVTVQEGKLFLAGRIEVDRVLGQGGRRSHNRTGASLASGRPHRGEDGHREHR